MPVRIALAGATGLVGQEILNVLAEVAREGTVEIAPPILFATARAAGETLPWIEEDEELVVEPFSAETARGVQFAITAVPAAASATLAPEMRKLGIPTVDLSRQHRATAPLYIDARPTSLQGATVVALPSPEAALTVRLIEALRELQPIRVGGTYLRPASAAGQAGVGDLAEATGRLLNGQEPEAPALGHRLAFNVVPQAGAFTGADAEAELDLSDEVRKLCGDAAPAISSTVAFAPWFHGHFASLELQFARPVKADAVRAALEKASRVKVIDDPAAAVYPMPLLATGDDAVQVGRLRVDAADPTRLRLVAAMDGVRSTAVLAVDALLALVRSAQSH